MKYFDHNASSPLLPVARQAWLQAADQFPGNPSSPHRVGARAEAALNQTRAQIAQWLGCDPMDLVWTSGATEANNMALCHMAATLSSQAEIWLSAIEHPCVLQAAAYYFRDRHRLIPVTPEGIVDLDWLTSHLADRTPGLVAVMAANNETGILQPWREVRALCSQYNVPYLCDAVQWLGKLPAQGLGECDFVSGCAHKFGGPKGVGFLKCPARGRFIALLHGGPQEEGRRAGTENVPAVLSMGAALDFCEHGMRNQDHRARLQWRIAFEDRLLRELPGSQLTGGRVDRLWNTVSTLMPPLDCRARWVVKLDKAGWSVSTGSACSSGKEKPSHVLAAMGIAAEDASRVLRLSSGWSSTEEDWQGLLTALGTVYQELLLQGDLAAKTLRSS